MHHCEHASNALPLPIMSALISVKLVHSQTPVHAARPWIRDVHVYSPASGFRWVLIRPNHGGIAQAE